MSDSWRGIRLRRPCVLDIFCGGGGAARGLLAAGFQTVVGVDRDDHRASYESVPGMHFVQMDVAELTADDLAHFTIVWASPPCQAFSRIIPRSMRETHQKRWQEKGRHADLVPWARDILRRSGRPYIIENVPGAPLQEPLVRLCGTQMDPPLAVFRHRIFESNVALQEPERACDHRGCSLGERGRHVHRPHAEMYADPAWRLPDSVRTVEVRFPCRSEDRPDFIYEATTDATKALFRRHYKRTYARSVKEVARATGALVPNPEYATELRAYNERRAAARAKGKKLMYPVYGASTASRGTTDEWRRALGCPDAQMTREELAQCVPPAYAAFLGRQLLRAHSEAPVLPPKKRRLARGISNT